MLPGRFLCPAEDVWTAFEQNLRRFVTFAALPIVVGVTSASYIYRVRERISRLVTEIDEKLIVVDKSSRGGILLR